MRRLYILPVDLPEDAETTVGRLLTALAGEPMCPNLRHLECHVLTPTLLPLIPLLISPRLTRLTLKDDTFHDELTFSDLGLILQVLPTTRLEELCLSFDSNLMHRFASQISLVVQQCGDSLRLLDVPIPLGEETVLHLSSLKGLRVWTSVYDPPPITTAFPPLQSLTLCSREAHAWIPWLTRREKSDPNAYGGPLEHSTHTSIAHLTSLEPVSIDATFISPLLFWSNLVTLIVPSDCQEGLSCTFSLTDPDVMQLSAALPRLEVLELGSPCDSNAVRTTICCLLALSVRCKGLRTLSIHFNPTNLANDFRSLSTDPDLRDLRSLSARCPLESFTAGCLLFPDEMPGEECVMVARGFMDLFPTLPHIDFNHDNNWGFLSLMIGMFRRTDV